MCVWSTHSSTRLFRQNEEKCKCKLTQILAVRITAMLKGNENSGDLSDYTVAHCCVVATEEFSLGRWLHRAVECLLCSTAVVLGNGLRYGEQ